MSILKSTRYAPDIYKRLNGIILLYKPPDLSPTDYHQQFRHHLSDILNQYEPRPLDKRLSIEGGYDEEKRVVARPNLADHPLVVGPRYNPWELSLISAPPYLGTKSSGIDLMLMGTAAKQYLHLMRKSKLVNVYHITGCFGFITDTFFHDGKIQDKATYKHIRSGKMDAALSKIEASQQQRLFDAANVPLQSQEAYELAKAWPSRPARMSSWPVIYRIRCLHLKLPEFKIEVTISNPNEKFLAQLPHDIGLLLKSAAHTKSIRRVKVGPFDVNDALTDKDWDINSIINHLNVYHDQHPEIQRLFDNLYQARKIRVEHNI